MARTALTKDEERLFRLAGLVAGLLAAGPLFSLVAETPWPASLGWFGVAVGVVTLAGVAWAVIVSLWYKRARLSVKRKTAVAILATPALALAVRFLLPVFLREAWGEVTLAIALREAGLWLGGSLALSLLLWSMWRFELWVERRWGRTK